MRMNYNKNFKIRSMGCNSNLIPILFIEFDNNLLIESVT